MRSDLCHAFLLTPSGKDYLWGGERLKTEYGKALPLSPLAETWECSAHPAGPSTAVSGPHRGETLAAILEAHPEYLGTRHPDGVLPVLVKLIDAAQDLSVQVHPDDAFAARFENGAQGKTEMWYILDAAPGSTLVYGLAHDMTAQEVRSAALSGTLGDHLNRVSVRPGDVFFLPAGTIHAIGAGLLLAEVQQNSDLTYRLYDYARRGKDGALRPLHLDKALACADLRPTAPAARAVRVVRRFAGYSLEELCRAPRFRVEKLTLDAGADAAALLPPCPSACRVLLCTRGAAVLPCGGETLSLRAGTCAFVPAGQEAIPLYGQAELLLID